MTDITNPRQAYYDRRNKETEEKINNAARKILAADGTEKFSIEEVARVSKVAKTTIYRRAPEGAIELATQALKLEDEKVTAIIENIIECALTVAGALPDVGIGTDASAEIILAAGLKKMQDERRA